MIKDLLDTLKYTVIAVVIALITVNFIFYIVNVDGNSMNPTLKNGDKLIVEKVSYYFTKPSVGDIVVVKNPSFVREKLIKRVIALPGDKVIGINGELYVNGKKIDEKYIEEKMKNDFLEVIVPENSVFVLGDNRNHSIDSRSESIGTINYKLVMGKAIFRIFPLRQIGVVK